MLAIINLAAKHPAIYLGGCFLVGLAIRLGMAHGDLGLFFNPLYPIFVR